MKKIDFNLIKLGTKFDHEYVIGDAVYKNFLAAFSDHSPIHVDEDYAKKRGFPARVAHGTILNGFLSHFVGMVFPGEQALLLSVDISYLQPAFISDRLFLEVNIAQILESHRVLVLNFKFKNLSQNTNAAKGRIQVAVAE